MLELNLEGGAELGALQVLGYVFGFSFSQSVYEN